MRPLHRLTSGTVAIAVILACVAVPLAGQTGRGARPAPRPSPPQPPAAPAPPTESGGEVLTNQAVMQMVLAKLPKDVIQAKIQSARSNFDVTVNGLSGLQSNHVPSDLMKAMLMAASKTSSRETLTNESVVQMVNSKIPHDVILAKIQASQRNFDVTSDGLVSLNTNHVPKDIIKVMMVGGS